MKLLILWLGFCLSFSNLTLAHTSTLVDAKVRAFIPGASNSVAYFTLKNESNLERTIVSVQVEGIGRVEMHQHEYLDGMMKMSELKTLAIKARSQVQFRPGGLHLMLFEPVKLPEPGQSVTLKINFKDGDVISTQANVVKLGLRPQDHSRHH